MMDELQGELCSSLRSFVLLSFGFQQPIWRYFMEKNVWFIVIDYFDKIIFGKDSIVWRFNCSIVQNSVNFVKSNFEVCPGGKNILEFKFCEIWYSYKNFLKKTSFQVEMDLKKGQKQGRDEKTQQHYPTTKWQQAPFWPPMQRNCIPSPLCCVQSELGMKVHCIGGQKGGLQHSVALFLSFFKSIPIWKELFQKNLHLVFVIFGRFLRNFQAGSERVNKITLQTNALMLRLYKQRLAECKSLIAFRICLGIFRFIWKFIELVGSFGFSQ